MSGASVVLAAARADFLERVRRYSFLFTLGLALYFGYMATVGKLTLRVGDSRGVYNSAWIGGLLAVVGSTFITLAGFYFVKNSLQRDTETRVGQILAATPISRFTYVLGKFVSNFAVLASMIGILALSSIIMQLVNGEDRHIHFWKLLAPFLLVSLPAMAVIAALAIVFETIPFLRGGFGNIAYFFLWTAILTAPIFTKSLMCDLSGLFLLQRSIIASHVAPAAEHSFSLSIDAGQFKTTSIFRWEGVSWTMEVLFSRLVLFVVALLLCVLAAELRLILKGQRWWWYTIAAGLLLAQALTSKAEARGMVLAFAWIWPVLLWSSMGVREIRCQTHQILFAAPHPLARQLPAVWLAGVLLAVVTGSGCALRLLLERNLPGFFAWTVGALFIPTAALCLGVWSSSSKPFEILYTLLWYIGPMHAMPALDFMGSSPATAATHYPLYYLAFTAILFVLALLIVAAAGFVGLIVIFAVIGAKYLEAREREELEN